MNYEELKEAVALFGLSGRATLKEIRARHRQMVKRHHPDAGADTDPAMIRRINDAYAVLSRYVADYRYDFGEAEFYEQNPEERLRFQFAGDPLWGGR
jgi:DnaJ-class molecular chaperone